MCDLSSRTIDELIVTVYFEKKNFLIQTISDILSSEELWQMRMDQFGERYVVYIKILYDRQEDHHKRKWSEQNAYLCNRMCLWHRNMTKVLRDDDINHNNIFAVLQKHSCFLTEGLEKMSALLWIASTTFSWRNRLLQL